MYFLATETECNESNNYTKLVVVEVSEQKLPKVDGNCITRDTEEDINIAVTHRSAKGVHTLYQQSGKLISAFLAFNLSSVSSALNLRNVRENRVQSSVKLQCIKRESTWDTDIAVPSEIA